MDIFCKVCVMVVSSVIGVGVGILCGVIVLKVFYSIRNFRYNHKEKVFMIQFIPSGFEDNNLTLTNRFKDITHIKAKNSAEAIGEFMDGHRVGDFPYILRVKCVAD